MILARGLAECKMIDITYNRCLDSAALNSAALNSAALDSAALDSAALDSARAPEPLGRQPFCHFLRSKSEKIKIHSIMVCRMSTLRKDGYWLNSSNTRKENNIPSCGRRRDCMSKTPGISLVVLLLTSWSFVWTALVMKTRKYPNRARVFLDYKI